MSTAKSAATITAELAGSNTCTAVGITVTGNAPVLMLCRRLLEAGRDPDQALEVYRGATLALRIRSIGEGARLTVKEPNRGRAHFARWQALSAASVVPSASPGSPPIAPMPADDTYDGQDD